MATISVRQGHSTETTCKRTTIDHSVPPHPIPARKASQPASQPAVGQVEGQTLRIYHMDERFDDSRKNKSAIAAPDASS